MHDGRIIKDVMYVNNVTESIMKIHIFVIIQLVSQIFIYLIRYNFGFVSTVLMLRLILGSLIFLSHIHRRFP